MVKSRIELLQGDITTVPVDGIVNAANSALAGGGGVDGAIHRAAGAEQLQQACRQYNGCPTGEVRSTPAFNLPAKRVLHTVGPIWQGGHSGEPELLADCYRNTLKLAVKESLLSVSFPAISCGVYGYPHQSATEIALFETCQFLTHHNELEKVIFVLFDQPLYQLYQKTLRTLSAI
ncbi:O-acetyl-ADP-ribose deacetylase [Endozoicomonas arenosclerae]|uniref:O-acetyl-ADP-ribose deacetylase n=1 Tax=Endozoicomonas arenosclerae TaxID=1633495 RepID=UPI000785FB14|nr:O-acetyl-ADP-ribose deacetylase [Endozoicomonas arenosclerae]